jgi:hypothetical protein
MKLKSVIFTSLLMLLFLFSTNNALFAQNKSKNYTTLVELFTQWRIFEQPPLLNGAPDYTVASFNRRQPNFIQLRKKLLSIDTVGWSIKEKVDWRIIWAEMNGYDFNVRILKPWQRDPAFYKSIYTERSDVPAHEGPTHHMVTDVWKYNFPLTANDRKVFISSLKGIAALNNQAKINLTGNAKELWIAGIRDIQTQSDDLAEIMTKPGCATDKELTQLLKEGIASTNDLVQWLEKQSVKKTGASGIGKENYNWYQKNVHLVPLTWDDQVLLLKRELTRSWAALKMEEHRNRKLPLLELANTPEANNILAEKSFKSLIQFLNTQEVLTIKPYFDSAIRAHKLGFFPTEKRNFFQITAAYDPRPLYSHFYHWFELARMDIEHNQNEIRRSPLLYNLFDTRNEGLATTVEETFMQAGLYDDNPRVKEIVYIMLAQRAARGLGSLYAHANMLTMEEAGKIHSNYTPRGWMKTEKKLLLFEQHLFMRQPGYGSSYIVGKYLLENAMAEVAKRNELLNKAFSIKDFLDQLNEIGCIPASLSAWEISGIDIWNEK